jgi:hypothetical protein
MVTLVTNNFLAGSNGNPDAKRLYDDLLSDYNKLVRPVKNATDAVQETVSVYTNYPFNLLTDINKLNPTDVGQGTI